MQIQLLRTHNHNISAQDNRTAIGAVIQADVHYRSNYFIQHNSIIQIDQKTSYFGLGSGSGFGFGSRGGSSSAFFDRGGEGGCGGQGTGAGGTGLGVGFRMSEALTMVVFRRVDERPSPSAEESVGYLGDGGLDGTGGTGGGGLGSRAGGGGERERARVDPCPFLYC